MIKIDQFYLRWHGRVAGPCTWAEVERKLDAHEIGVLHDLQQGDHWITLGEFLASRGESVRTTPNVPIAAPPTAADLRADSVAPAPNAPGQRLVRIPDRWVFVSLGFVFGFLAARDFYAQRWIRGSIFLTITALLWLLDWTRIWPWFQPIVEAIINRIRAAIPWNRKPKQ
jgi:hypothetical protein